MLDTIILVIAGVLVGLVIVKFAIGALKKVATVAFFVGIIFLAYFSFHQYGNGPTGSASSTINYTLTTLSSTPEKIKTIEKTVTEKIADAQDTAHQITQTISSAKVAAESLTKLNSHTNKTLNNS